MHSETINQVLSKKLIKIVCGLQQVKNILITTEKLAIVL